VADERGNGRVTFFACTKKVTKEMHPNDAALRANHEPSRKSKVVPTRHPCRDGTKCAIHGAFTSLLQLGSRQHRKGGGNPKPKPRFWRKCPSNLRLTNLRSIHFRHDHLFWHRLAIVLCVAHPIGQYHHRVLNFKVIELAE